VDAAQAVLDLTDGMITDVAIEAVGRAGDAAARDEAMAASDTFGAATT
jgi:hypothetical protein